MKIKKRVIISLFIGSFLFMALCAFHVSPATAAGVTTPPIIIETDPNIFPPQSDVSTSPTIVVQFSKDMDEDYFQPGLCAFTLYKVVSMTELIPVDGTCSVDGKVLTFVPSSALSENSTYQISISKDARDLNGNKFDGNENGVGGEEGDSISWYFYTMADDTPPYITDCSPASGETDAPINTAISLHIQDNSSGVDPNSIVLQINSTIVGHVISGQPKDKVISYVPSPVFGYSQEVMVSVYAEDFQGNSVNYSYLFNTVEETYVPPPADEYWSSETKAIPNISDLAIDGKDRLWVASRQGAEGQVGGVDMFDGTNWSHYSTEDEEGLPGNDITALALDSQNNLWVGLGLEANMGNDPNTVPKVAKFNGTTWTSYSASLLKMPYDEEINDLAIDPNDSIWIATGSSGAIFYDQKVTIKYDSGSGLETDNVKAVTIGNCGRVWFGTAYFGVISLSEGNFEQFSYLVHAKDPVDFVINGLAVGSNKKVWVATNSGLLGLEPETKEWTRYVTTNSGLPDNFVNTVAVDNLSSSLWVGTDSGLAKFEFNESTWTNYSTDEPYYADLLSTQGITKIAINPKGEMWVATNNTLARRDALCPKVSSVSPTDGQKNVSKKTSVTVTFTEAMDASSKEFLGVYDSKNKKVAGTWTLVGNTFTFTPSSSLKEGAKYTIKASAQVEDLLGNKLDGDGDGLGGETTEDAFSSTFSVKPATSSNAGSGGATGSTGGYTGGLFGGVGLDFGFNFGAGLMSYYTPLNLSFQNNLFTQYNTWNIFSTFDLGFQFNQLNLFTQGTGFNFNYNNFGFQNWSNWNSLF